MPEGRQIVCDCADVPPTMPTCRSEHLIDCPVRVAAAVANTEMMVRASEEAGRLLAADDREGLAAFLSRNNRERAEAARLRHRAVDQLIYGADGEDDPEWLGHLPWDVRVYYQKVVAQARGLREPS